MHVSEILDATSDLNISAWWPKSQVGTFLLLLVSRNNWRILYVTKNSEADKSFALYCKLRLVLLCRFGIYEIEVPTCVTTHSLNY